MVLTIDIGNTNTVLGVFDGDKLLTVARISTDISKTEDEYAVTLLEILSLKGILKKDVTGTIISSVVPALNINVSRAVMLAFNVEPMIVSPGIKTGLMIHCDNPASVGSDIICACVAAKKNLKMPCLIIDMGTATKMTALDKNGTFIGVSIIPGVMMGLHALSNSTAQLPQISLEAPNGLIGKNTADSMKSGVIYGNSAMIDGMVDLFKKELGNELTIIATGGLSSTVISYCKNEIDIDEHMVLKGLNILYNKNT